MSTRTSSKRARTSAHDLDAAELGHPQVEQQHVGLQRLGQRERLGAVGGEPDHLHGRVALEQRGRALAHQAVIVGDEHPHRSMVLRVHG